MKLKDILNLYKLKEDEALSTTIPTTDPEVTSSLEMSFDALKSKKENSYKDKEDNKKNANKPEEKLELETDISDDEDDDSYDIDDYYDVKQDENYDSGFGFDMEPVETEENKADESRGKLLLLKKITKYLKYFNDLIDLANQSLLKDPINNAELLNVISEIEEKKDDVHFFINFRIDSETNNDVLEFITVLEKYISEIADKIEKSSEIKKPG